MVQPWPMDPPLSDKDPADPVRGIAVAEHVKKCPLDFFFYFLFFILFYYFLFFIYLFFYFLFFIFYLFYFLFFIFYFLIKKRLMKTISIESLIGKGEGSSSISENAIQVAMSWFVSV